MVPFLSVLLLCFNRPCVETFEKRGGRSVTIIFLLLGTVLLRTLYVDVFNFFGIQGGFCYTNVFPPYRFLEYFCGMCLGGLYTKIERQVNTSIQVAGFVGFIILLLVHTYIQSMGPLFIVGEIFLLYSLFFFEGIVDKVGSSAVIKKLSDLTLPFFIFHQIVIKYVKWIFERFSFDPLEYKDLIWCGILALAIIVSYFMRNVCNEFRQHFLPSKRK